MSTGSGGGISITVCIANYNGIAVLDDCLRSVLAQRFDAQPDAGTMPRIDIIVHDDASTDDSVAHIRAHYPQVRLIASAQNVGFCIANNRMAAAAETDYLLLLNNDAALYPDAVATLLARACAIGAPAVLGLPQYSAATGALIDIGSRFDPFLNPIPDLRQDTRQREAGMIIGACLWLPQALWREIGGFPDWFDSLAEDMYLCCVARLYGHPVEALRSSGFSHWVGASLGGGKVTDNRLATTSRRRILSERNKCYVMVLCYPAPLLQLVLPLHILLLLIEGAILALLKRSPRLFTTIYWNVPVSLWRERARLMTSRKAIQARRRISIAGFWRPFQAMPHKLTLLLRHGVPEIR